MRWLTRSGTGCPACSTPLPFRKHNMGNHTSDRPSHPAALGWLVVSGEAYVFSVEALAASRSVDRFGPMDSDDRVDAYLVLGKPRR